MRLFRSFSIGLCALGLTFGLGLVVPAYAGHNTALNCQTENGVRVYRAAPTAALSQNQQALLVQKRHIATIKANQEARAQRQAAQARASEKAYERGFEKGVNAAQKAAQKSNRRYRRNRYNYGRRYVTSSLYPYYFGYR